MDFITDKFIKRLNEKSPIEQLTDAEKHDLILKWFKEWNDPFKCGSKCPFYNRCNLLPGLMTYCKIIL